MNRVLQFQLQSVPDRLQICRTTCTFIKNMQRPSLSVVSKRYPQKRKQWHLFLQLIDSAACINQTLSKTEVKLRRFEYFYHQIRSIKQMSR